MICRSFHILVNMYTIFWNELNHPLLLWIPSCLGCLRMDSLRDAKIGCLWYRISCLYKIRCSNSWLHLLNFNKTLWPWTNSNCHIWCSGDPWGNLSFSSSYNINFYSSSSSSNEFNFYSSNNEFNLYNSSCSAAAAFGMTTPSRSSSQGTRTNAMSGQTEIMSSAWIKRNKKWSQGYYQDLAGVFQSHDHCYGFVHFVTLFVLGFIIL